MRYLVILALLLIVPPCFADTTSTSGSDHDVLQGDSVHTTAIRNLQEDAENHTHEYTDSEGKDEDTQRQAFGAGAGIDFLHYIAEDTAIKSETRYDVVNRELRTYAVLQFEL